MDNYYMYLLLTCDASRHVNYECVNHVFDAEVTFREEGADSRTTSTCHVALIYRIRHRRRRDFIARQHVSIRNSTHVVWVLVDRLHWAVRAFITIV
jgi:hypothetical protein